MLLAHRGFDVEVFEKQNQVGGRNGALRVDGYTFDIGPTFLMMRNIIDEMFALCGRKTEAYLDIRELHPMYRLKLGDGRDFSPIRDAVKMRAQLDALFPGEWEGYQRFLAYEKRKLARITPCLQVPYSSLGSYLSGRMLRALPYLDAHKSLFEHLGDFFHSDLLKLAFTFQAKYLGMSPWLCPATFSIISYLEHSGGIHHIMGGLNQLSQALAKAATEDGAKIHLATPVTEVMVTHGRATGLKLQNGETIQADAVVLNADFAHAMTHLVKPEHRQRWNDAKLKKAGFSCSTFMLYLGIDRTYDIPHHNVIFAPDYRQNVREIAETQVLSEDPSIYIQNACVTDSTLAPPGHSTIYLLVPTANNRGSIDWAKEAPMYRDKVLELVESRGGLSDLRKHIKAERMITPHDWEHQLDVYAGATFNLAHNVGQMLYLRPHNSFEDIRDCYLVGGGTHPGSGVPTILESGRISADLIERKFNTPT